MLMVTLYNGAETAEKLADIDDCGPEETVLGPFENVQVTYQDHVKCYQADGNVIDLFWNDKQLIEHGGKVFGDINIHPAK